MEVAVRQLPEGVLGGVLSGLVNELSGEVDGDLNRLRSEIGKSNDKIKTTSEQLETIAAKYGAAL